MLPAGRYGSCTQISILGGCVGPVLQESGGLPAFCCCLVTIKGLFHPQVEANYRPGLPKYSLLALLSHSLPRQRS